MNPDIKITATQDMRDDDLQQEELKKVARLIAQMFVKQMPKTPEQIRDKSVSTIKTSNSLH